MMLILSSSSCQRLRNFLESAAPLAWDDSGTLAGRQAIKLVQCAPPSPPQVVENPTCSVPA